MTNTHWCDEHKTPFEKHTKGGKVWYSHKTEDGSWCNEPKTEEKAPSKAPSKVPSQDKPPRESQPIMSKGDWAEKDRITRISIQRQTSLNAAIELAKIKGADDAKRVLATAIFFEHYLETGISPFKAEGVKDEPKAKTNDETQISKTEGEVSPPEVVEEETPPTTVRELMDWAFSKGKEFVPSWVRKEGGAKPMEVLTNIKVAEIYKTLKEKMGWD